MKARERGWTRRGLLENDRHRQRTDLCNVCQPDTGKQGVGLQERDEETRARARGGCTVCNRAARKEMRKERTGETIQWIAQLEAAAQNLNMTLEILRWNYQNWVFRFHLLDLAATRFAGLISMFRVNFQIQVESWQFSLFRNSQVDDTQRVGGHISAIWTDYHESNSLWSCHG